jgi:hypothetical protein
MPIVPAQYALHTPPHRNKTNDQTLLKNQGEQHTSKKSKKKFEKQIRLTTGDYTNGEDSNGKKTNGEKAEGYSTYGD